MFLNQQYHHRHRVLDASQLVSVPGILKSTVANLKEPTWEPRQAFFVLEARGPPGP